MLESSPLGRRHRVIGWWQSVGSVRSVGLERSGVGTCRARPPAPFGAAVEARAGARLAT